MNMTNRLKVFKQRMEAYKQSERLRPRKMTAEEVDKWRRGYISFPNQPYVPKLGSKRG